jgi:hypothetical protein
MTFIRLYNKVFCVMQWNIGFSRGNIEEIIRQKKFNLPVKWLPMPIGDVSIADPFVFRDPTGSLHLLYEEFSEIDRSRYGKILLANLDKDLNLSSNKELLDAKSHASYPFIFFENDKTYIIPETSKQGKVSIYEYDFAHQSLINEKVIINGLPLLDSTIFQHNGKYWLFATYAKNEYDYSRLYIYYADSLLGPYVPHANNPVKNNVNGSRPAGSIIKVDGEIFRPSQNCGQHYGTSISINKITKLSENEFAEEFYFKIEPDKNSAFNAGVHTLNVVDDIIVIDGIKMLFRPLTKGKLFFKKKLQK